MGGCMTTLTMADVAAARIELHKRKLCPLTEADIAPKLIPVFEGEADFRFAHGGRGSSKSVGFHKMAATLGAIWDAMGKTGVILCIREFMNSLDDSSLQDVKSAIQADAWLTSVYDVGEKYVRTKSGRIKFIFAGTSVNLDSIKSKAKVLLVVAEEAENIPGPAWEKIVPTVREEGSEIWAIYNPETEKSWVHKNLRMSKDPMTKGVEINFRDNPWWNSKLERLRVKSMNEDPDNYGHIWEGEFKTAFQGSYYAAHLTQAEVARPKRITSLTADPLMTIRAYWDIGGTGQKADATAIWIVQFVGQNIYVLDHYEAVGQPLSTHVAWLRKNGYEDALCILPHDGVNHEKIYKVTYESALREAGFAVRVIPNQGAGAAMLRVEAARRLFPRIWFNEETTLSGRTALRAYREKWDENRNVGLGPLHDWSSNSADSFGLMCIDWEEPRVQKKKSSGRPGGSGSWMG